MCRDSPNFLEDSVLEKLVASACPDGHVFMLDICPKADFHEKVEFRESVVKFLEIFRVVVRQEAKLRSNSRLLKQLPFNLCRTPDRLRNSSRQAFKLTTRKNSQSQKENSRFLPLKNRLGSLCQNSPVRNSPQRSRKRPLSEHKTLSYQNSL